MSREFTTRLAQVMFFTCSNSSKSCVRISSLEFLTFPRLLMFLFFRETIDWMPFWVLGKKKSASVDYLSLFKNSCLNRCCLMAFSDTSRQICVSSTTPDGMEKLSSDNFFNLLFAISSSISSRKPMPDLSFLVFPKEF